MTDQEKDDGLERELDSVTREYIDLQISCMLLQHAACLEMRKSDQTKGLKMFEATRDLRDSLGEQLERIIESIGVEGLNACCERIGLEKILYSSLSDAAFKSNAHLFKIGPRPQGAEYACDDASCEQKMRMVTLEYFPELFAAA